MILHFSLQLFRCLPFSKKNSGNFGWKSNGTVDFWKSCSQIVDFLQRQSSVSFRNGTAEISASFAQLSSFQSLISRKQLRKIKLNCKWQAPFRSVGLLFLKKPLPLFNGRPNRFILTNGKHPFTPKHTGLARGRSRWKNLGRGQYRFQPIKFVTDLVVPSPCEAEHI